MTNPIEPNPIFWKRPLKGVRGILLCLALLWVAAFVVVFCLGLITRINFNMAEWVAASAAIGLGISLFVVGGFLFVRLLSNWRNFRRFLFAIACLITLIALFYAEENARGKWAFEKFKSAAEARGEKFDLKDFIPPPVPDDQNLALTPLLRPTFDFERDINGMHLRDTNALAQLNEIQIDLGLNAYRRNHTNEPPQLSSMDDPNLTDLEAFQAFYQSNTNYPQLTTNGTAAEAVLVAVGKFDSQLNELRHAAMTRPQARFPIQYDEQPPFDILLPHLAHLKNLCRVFELRAIARLAMHQPAEALADLQTAFRLSDSLRNEPFLIDHLVRLATLIIELQGVREGLARHAWNDAQLMVIQNYLASLDLLAEFQHIMRGERSLNLGGLEFYRQQGFHRNPFLEMENQGHTSGGGFNPMPSGWYYQNMLGIAQLYQDYILPSVNQTNHRVFLQLGRNMDQNLKAREMTPYNVFVKLLMPAFIKASSRTARSQTQVDEAVVACALERYRLARGKLPDTLEALVPEFIAKIPNDLFDGHPLRYEKKADGSYLLYSLGANETDDGGSVAFRKGKTPSVDPNRGDWVWQLPQAK